MSSTPRSPLEMTAVRSELSAAVDAKRPSTLSKASKTVISGRYTPAEPLVAVVCARSTATATTALLSTWLINRLSA